MIKQSGKRFIENQQEIGRKNAQLRKERKEYEADVKQAVLSAKRQAYKSEAIKQAELKAKIEAKRRYNPDPNQAPRYNLDAVLYPLGKPQSVQQQSTSKKKGQAKSMPQKKPVDAVRDLLNNLPD